MVAVVRFVVVVVVAATNGDGQAVIGLFEGRDHVRSRQVLAEQGRSREIHIRLLQIPMCIEDIAGLGDLDTIHSRTDDKRPVPSYRWSS